MFNVELHIVIWREKSFFRVQTVLGYFGQSSNKCIDSCRVQTILVEWKYKGDWIRFLIGVKRSKCYWQVRMDGTYHIKCKQYGILIDTSNYWVSRQWYDISFVKLVLIFHINVGSYKTVRIVWSRRYRLDSQVCIEFGLFYFEMGNWNWAGITWCCRPFYRLQEGQLGWVMTSVRVCCLCLFVLIFAQPI